jgi:SAM-dependent methyltransferase
MTDIALSNASMISQLRAPSPFELTPPWGDFEFSRRLYELAHDWGIPTEKEVALISTYLKPTGARILDLACGAGRHSLLLASQGHLVTGIDIGGYPINLAIESARSRGLAVDFLRGNILDIDFREEFDMAYLICGQLTHFSPRDSSLIFLRAAQALADKGIFIIHVQRLTDQDKTYRFHWYMEKMPLYMKHISLIHREQYYFKEEKTKVIRDFAIDSVTMENGLFGFSEKEYGPEEIEKLASESGLYIKESFGSYDKERFRLQADNWIYVLAGK